MLSMASPGSAFKPYYRPDQLLVSVPEAKPLRTVYSDPEPAVSAQSPAESGAGKNRRKRTTFTQHQATILEKEYHQERYMVRDKRAQLAETLGLSEAQVKTWFQNRRAKDKREKKTDSPRRSPSDSANVSVADESVLETSQSSVKSPSPPAEARSQTPPPHLKPAASPVMPNHQVLPSLLQACPLPDYSQYYNGFGLNPVDPSATSLLATTLKTDSFCTEAAVRDIYKISSNMYDRNFGSIYSHVPFTVNPITSSSNPSFIPEPLAPISNNDTIAVEHKQLTAL